MSYHSAKVFAAHHVAVKVGESVETCLAHLAEMRPQVRPVFVLVVPHSVVFGGMATHANWADIAATNKQWLEHHHRLYHGLPRLVDRHHGPVFRLHRQRCCHGPVPRDSPLIKKLLLNLRFPA
jgi:hypothetical protein